MRILKFYLIFFSLLLSEGGFGDSVIISNNALYQEQLGKFLASELCMYRPQWKLCYRASSDGGDGKTFHEKCDGKPNTVTIVKVGEYVFGGYTNVPWGKDDISFPYHVSLQNRCVLGGYADITGVRIIFPRCQVPWRYKT